MVSLSDINEYLFQHVLNILAVIFNLTLDFIGVAFKLTGIIVQVGLIILPFGLVATAVFYLIRHLTGWLPFPGPEQEISDPG